MTNISADVATNLAFAWGPDGIETLPIAPLPWYFILWVVSIIGGLLIIPSIIVAGRIARKRSRPLHTYKLTLHFAIWAILGIGLINCLLSIAEALSTVALLNPGPWVTSMLFINLAQALKLLSVSIGLATIGGIALITTNEYRNNPQQGGPGYPPQGVGSPDP